MTNILYFERIVRDDESLSTEEVSSDISQQDIVQEGFAVKLTVWPLSSLMACLRAKSKHLIDESSGSFPSTPSSSQNEAKLLEYTNVAYISFAELKLATGNFHDDLLVGESDFGSVYKGWIDEYTLTAAEPGTGTVVAVKNLVHKGSHGHKEWLEKVNYVGRLCHPNLARLVGYCLEDAHQLLVYEFIPAGSLEDQLFRGQDPKVLPGATRKLRPTMADAEKSYSPPLSWTLRLKIALEAAKALAFLHNAESKVVHGDFKTSNILLDLNHSAKLSEYVLVKDAPSSDMLLETIAGDFDYKNIYAAPEDLLVGYLTAKSDVYSYGVVLLEILCGRRAVDFNKPFQQQFLVRWAQPYLKSAHVVPIMDRRLKGQYSLGDAQKTAMLARCCLSTKAIDRPSVDDIVTVLEQLYKKQTS